MEGLFEEKNNKQELFQNKEKKDLKKVFKKILVLVLILILLSGSAYGVFYYLTEIKNRDARADIIELAKHVNIDKYTDIEGLSSYFDNINANSYEFNAGIEVNNQELNNALKDMTKNEDINIKEFSLNFNGKVDKTSNKLQTFVDLKHKENSVINFQIQDTGDQIVLHGKDYFQEFIGVEKSKLKQFVSKEYSLDNDTATTVDNLTKVSLDTNYIKEGNAILKSILKSLPQALEVLTEENFEINRNVKVNYRNNSINTEKYSIKLTNQNFINFFERLASLSKVEANNESIALQSLVGKTDNMVTGFLGYFSQIIDLRLDENLNINIYRVRNNIAKIDFVKTKEETEDKLVFEIELISDKNSNEILISNDELKLKITITKDNSKIYTKIDIDGKVPVPSALDINESPIKEIDTDKEDKPEERNTSTRGESSLLASSVVISDPVPVPEEQEEPYDPNTPVSNENPLVNNNDTPASDTPTSDNPIEPAPVVSTPEVPSVDFVEDKESVPVNENVFTKKMDLKANLSFDRPLNNSSEMNFNLMFNSNQVEIILKAGIAIKDKVEIENPMKIVELTSMDAPRLKANMKAISDIVSSTLIKKLKSLGIMK